MKSVHIVFILAVAALVSGCASQENKMIEIAIVEQYSPFMSEWQDVALFYGYGENEEIAEKFVRAFEPSSERPLRVRAMKIKKKDLLKFRSSEKLKEKP